MRNGYGCAVQPDTLYASDCTCTGDRRTARGLQRRRMQRNPTILKRAGTVYACSSVSIAATAVLPLPVHAPDQVSVSRVCTTNMRNASSISEESGSAGGGT